MSQKGSRVLLISTQDRLWRDRFERMIGGFGVEGVEAHNCWSGEVVLNRDEIGAVVIDATIMCSTVSPDRPGPILVRSPEVPLIVINAGGLDEQQRLAATSHGAQLVEGADVEETGRLVEKLLNDA